MISLIVSGHQKQWSLGKWSHGVIINRRAFRDVNYSHGQLGDVTTETDNLAIVIRLGFWCKQVLQAPWTWILYTTNQECSPLPSGFYYSVCSGLPQLLELRFPARSSVVSKRFFIGSSRSSRSSSRHHHHRCRRRSSSSSGGSISS